ncbi:hypothetical protein [Dyella sp. Tek66A03]|uniref:hypothetical protein n=1 Tax=Dyella sp. Tek66A03 TaxID=3458298 RepID=UPI00403EBF40
MKTAIFAALAMTALFALPAFAGGHSSGYKAPRNSASGATSATPVLHSGYTKQNGTYVAPHYQTAPNQTKTDNWSSRPNVNPYTGKAGTKDPYAQANGH